MAGTILVVDVRPAHSTSHLSTSVYMALLLSAPILYELGVTLSGSDRIPGGPAVGPLALLLTMTASAVSCLLCQGDGEWSPPARVWFALVIVLWLYFAWAEASHDGRTDLAAIFVPLTAALLWLRKPRHVDVWTAGDVFAWVLIGASFTVLALEVVGVVPSWYRSMGGYFVELSIYDRESHWLLIGSALGLDGRWGGPLRDPNLMGPLGAFLVVYGFSRRRVKRIVFVLGGVLLVLLSDSRAAYAALAVGLLLLLLLPGWGSRLFTFTVPKVLAVVVGLAAGARLLRDYQVNPGGTLTMTGRTSMWPDFLSLWADSRMTGVGTPAIWQAIEDGRLPEWAAHGHNQYIDTVVRYGAVGLVLTCSVFALALGIAVVGASRGVGVGIAAMGVVFVATISNLAVDLRYPSPTFSVILLAVLLAATAPRSAANATPAWEGASP